MKHACVLDDAYEITQLDQQLPLLVEYMNHQLAVPSFWQLRNSVNGEDPVVFAWKNCRQPRPKAMILTQLARHQDKERIARVVEDMRSVLLHVPILDREAMTWRTELVFIDTGIIYSVDTALDRLEAATQDIVPPTYPDVWQAQAAYLPITGMVN